MQEQIKEKSAARYAAVKILFAAVFILLSTGWMSLFLQMHVLHVGLQYPKNGLFFANVLVFVGVGGCLLMAFILSRRHTTNKKIRAGIAIVTILFTLFCVGFTACCFMQIVFA